MFFEHGVFKKEIEILHDIYWIALNRDLRKVFLQRQIMEPFFIIVFLIKPLMKPSKTKYS